MAPQLFDQRNVAHAQTKEKSVGIRLREGLLPGGHSDRIAGVDVRDSGGDDNSLRAGEEQARVGQRFAPDGFAEPERSIAKLLQLVSGLLCFRGGMILELTRPDSDRTNLYRCLCHGMLLILAECLQVHTQIGSLLRRYLRPGSDQLSPSQVVPGTIDGIDGG